MKRVRSWQLCRTGTFGADGATITLKDLEEIQSTFAPPRPISIGHDVARQDNFPKFGDVLAIDGIYDDGKHPGEKVLVGNVVLHPELEKLFDDKADGNGVYSGWSVTIPRRASDGKRYLHSIAICGAVPPKIPGLEQLMVSAGYADKDKVESFDFNDSIEFQEESSMTEEEKKKMEALEAENKKLKEQASKKDEEDKKKDEMSEKLSREHEELLKSFEKLESKSAENAVKALTDRFGDKIPVAAKSKLKAVAGVLAGHKDDIEFSDGSKTEKMSALDMFADLMAVLTADSTDITNRKIDPAEFSDTGKDGKEKIDWNKVAGNL